MLYYRHLNNDTSITPKRIKDIAESIGAFTSGVFSIVLLKNHVTNMLYRTNIELNSYIYTISFNSLSHFKRQLEALKEYNIQEKNESDNETYLHLDISDCLNDSLWKYTRYFDLKFI